MVDAEHGPKLRFGAAKSFVRGGKAAAAAAAAEAAEAVANAAAGAAANFANTQAAVDTAADSSKKAAADAAREQNTDDAHSISTELFIYSFCKLLVAVFFLECRGSLGR